MLSSRPDDARPRRLVDRAVLEVLAATSADWFALYDVEGPTAFRHDWVDPRAHTLGYATDDLHGRLVSEVFAASVAARFHENANLAIARRGPVRYEATGPGVAGDCSIEITMSPVLDGDRCDQLLVTMRDVTARVASDSERASTERRLHKLMENAPDIVWLIDAEGIIRYATSATERLLGYSPEQLIGRSSFVLVPPTDLAPMQAFFGELLAAAPGTPMQSELRTLHRDGSILWTEITVTNMLDDPDVGAIVVNAHDVTGLPNRILVTERLNVMLANASGDERLAAAFFIDFDGFKLINDTLGHEVGDLVIREAAHRLTDAVGTRGWVARFGGDEFVVAANRLDTIDAHLALARDVRAALAVPYLLNRTPIYLTASVGIATGTGSSGVDADTLIRHADMAMYEAKRMKLPVARLFDDSLRDIAERRLETMNSLRTALERDELVLHYQPVFDIATRTPIGVEALVRWNHPTKGLVPPGEFIPIAEETGLIVPIGDWVLERACAQSAAWSAAGLGRIRSSVNVSPKQLADPGFVRKLRSALARSGIAPAMLTVEITENLIMDDPDAAQSVLEEVAALGVTVAIDDFGRGYSSLAFLSRFPAHLLKIDRMFVDQLDRDGPAPRRRNERRPGTTLVSAIIDMAHALGLEVIAEGVETDDQLRALRALGCEYAQGYLLARPQRADLTAEVFRAVGRPLAATLPHERVNR